MYISVLIYKTWLSVNRWRPIISMWSMPKPPIYRTTGINLPAIVTGNSVPDTNKIDTIQVFDISTCQKILPVLDAFPTTLSEKNQVLDRRFSILGYDEIPQIDDFGWDGVSTFAFVGYNKNGYGPLYMYHMDSGEIESAGQPHRRRVLLS